MAMEIAGKIYRSRSFQKVLAKSLIPKRAIQKNMYQVGGTTLPEKVFTEAQQTSHRGGEIGTTRVHVLGNIITANSKNVEYMLKTRLDNYPIGKTFSAILGDLLGRGIFNVSGHLWKFQREMACLELGNLSAKSYASEIVVSEIHSRLIPLLSSVAGKENGVLHLQEVFQRFSFDSTCKFSFGQDLGCVKLSLFVSEFAVAFDLASKLSLP
ncbi:cytochrome P450 94C1-like [Olea europaea subsp. europaea]|uniref:Cytochrome P450 94C1-like n=1 Tax=Olea europaea subsp. europaea TaxID=158383 RepID=A0A8S0SR26_OLEEU|nr:cytochrome P450 94C1-like [Olea europaea subsp. europaea]